MMRPALLDTIAAFRRTLASARATPQELFAIVLVGGSSRIPLVGELLQGEFAAPLSIDTHPKHDIALGAALLCQDRDAGRSPAPAPGLAPTPGPAAGLGRRPVRRSGLSRRGGGGLQRAVGGGRDVAGAGGRALPGATPGDRATGAGAPRVARRRGGRASHARGAGVDAGRRPSSRSSSWSPCARQTPRRGPGWIRASRRGADRRRCRGRCGACTPPGSGPAVLRAAEELREASPPTGCRRRW